MDNTGNEGDDTSFAENYTNLIVPQSLLHLISSKVFCGVSAGTKYSIYQKFAQNKFESNDLHVQENGIVFGDHIALW